ncbi:MAG: hypothetical protein ABI831_22970, partial [Betaproteobacteria bacterium]
MRARRCGGGGLYPNQVTRFTGVARAVMQPDESVVVASGEADGSFGNVRAVTMFRATPNGTLDTAFRPQALPAGANAAVALGARPDGHILYGTIDGGSAVLQQFLTDGSPDPSFGLGGAVSFPIGGNPVIHGNLVVLVDGSVVFAVFDDDTVRIFKVDASGNADARFGTDGRFVLTGPQFQRTISPGPALLALADGTFLAAYRVTVREIPLELPIEGTGHQFRAFVPESGVATGALPACRFYGTPGIGSNSHFHTVESNECAS